MNTLKETFYTRNPKLTHLEQEIDTAISVMLESAKNKKALLFCGNGGSAADSDHIVGELMKGFVLKRPLPDALKTALIKDYDNGEFLANTLQQGIAAISLTHHSALNFAVHNDLHGDLIFAQQVLGYAPISGVVVGMSTSGNAENIINAFKVAKTQGLKTILLSGETGGKLKAFADIAICVPESETYKVQEYHLAIYHHICLMLESSLFDS